MSAGDYKFEGWLGLDPSAVKGKMQWGEFEPKPWEETDVDIKVTHCGICGSDLHTLRSGWVCSQVPFLSLGSRNIPFLTLGYRDRPSTPALLATKSSAR